MIKPIQPLAAPNARSAWRPYPMDVLFAGVYLVVALVVDLGVSFTNSLFLFLIIVLLIAPLAWRRAAPERTVALVAAAAVLHLVVMAIALLAGDFGFDGMLLAHGAVLVAVYTAAAFGRRWLRWWSLPAAVLGLTTGFVLIYTPPSGVIVSDPLTTGDYASATMQGLSMAVLVVVVAWIAGLLRRALLSNRKTEAEKAELAQRDRVRQAEVAAGEERARIARDLHDIVAHSVAVMVAQANGGRYAARAEPTAALPALETIAETGSSTLAEIRRLVAVVRDGDSDSSRPQPGLTDVPELIDRINALGVPVTLSWQGHARPVEQGVAVAVHRIVQEGLTNVLKHAGDGATAAVTVTWTDHALVLDIIDNGDGPSTTSDGAGQGLLGMRERVGAYGGTLEAGRSPTGGFAIRATFPMAPPRADAATPPERTPETLVNPPAPLTDETLVDPPALQADETTRISA